MRKPIILILIEVYIPGFLAGGPVQSIANMVDQLGDEFQWKIITTDRDFHATEQYRNVPLNKWTKVGAAEVFYATPDEMSSIRLLQHLAATPHDLLYLNSFCSPRFSILPCMARVLHLLGRQPVLIAPRGEFSAGAFALKGWRKKAYVAMSRLLGIYSSVIWHVTTSHEADDISTVMRVPKSRVLIAGNLSKQFRVPAQSLARGPAEALRVCFLSRIARKKNLDFALRALAAVQHPVLFTIYGPAEDRNYWLECQALIACLPAHIKVRVEGPVPNADVNRVLCEHDLFFLPTRGENFGHVFVEAWCAALPVLTSDQTPWRNLHSLGVGWDIPLTDLHRFTEVIDKVSVLPPEELSQLRQRCVAFAREKTNDSVAREATRAMFFSLIKPDSGKPTEISR